MDGDPRRLLVAISDLHAGGSVAAMRTHVQMGDGASVHPGDLNLLLASKMQQGAEWARKRAEKLGSAGADVQGSVPVVLLHNGDLTEGIHHQTEQLMVPELIGPQVEIALDLLSVWTEALNPLAVAFTRGTQTHVGKAACNEEAAAKELEAKGVKVVRAPGSPQNRTAYSHHFRLGGHLILASHHGKIGQTPRTKTSLLALRAADIFSEESRLNWIREQAGEDPQDIPRLVIGSHHHQMAESGHHWPTQWIQTGCWTMRNSFGHKVAAFEQENIGFWTVYCDPDKRRPEVEPWQWHPRRDEPWTI